MSPSQIHIELPPFAMDSPSQSVGDSSALLSPPAASVHAFGLGSTNGALQSQSPSHAMMDESQFGDFGFSYQGLPETGPMSMDDHSADTFSSPSHPPASLSESQNHMSELARLSAAGASPTFGGAGGDQRRQGSNQSDADTADRRSPGVNSLEDSVADEFGLARDSTLDGLDHSRSKDEKTDIAPAWSELKTKAGKERKRLPLACIACRRKKIRCSGEKPACKHCLRSRIPCVYKVTTRKAAPRTDYMAMLDKRLKRMEERIIKVIPKSDQESATSNVTRAVVKPAIPGSLPPAKASAASKKRGVEEAFGHDLDNWARAPSKTKPNGATKATSLQIQEAEENKLFLEGLDALPSPEIQEHLAEVFFDNVYGQAYPVLHKPSYMRKLRARSLPPVLILSVCAVSARFSTHPKLSSTPNFLRGEEWAAPARDICTRRYEWPNITILTCLMVLGLHEFGTCHGGRSWSLGGQAIRMAFALQLHKDLEYDPQRIHGKTQLSFIDREIRRRTMWGCFLMDRLNSSGTDRPMFIREDTIKIPLPVLEKYYQLDIPAPTETLDGKVPLAAALAEDGQVADAKDNMGVAAYLVRVISVWGRIINYLNQGGKTGDAYPMWDPASEYAKLSKEAEEVQDLLPESLQYSAENLQLHGTENLANQFLFLHISIQQNILFVNRVAASVSSVGGPNADVPQDFIHAAGQKTFAAANRISELLKEAESYFVAAPFAGYCAFSSSTIHILGIFSGNPAMEASSKKNLATNVKFLSKMKRYWGMFHWMSENLREQYRQCADAARQGTNAKENAAASPIFQYGDWFDRYPHGVSQSDFADPASYKKKEKGEDAVLEQKPELHTVEEFFTTLSPPQSTEGGRGGGRGSLLKRKSLGKRSGSTGSAARSEQQQLEAHMAEMHQRAGSSDALSAHLHQRNFSNALGGQTSGPAGFNPLSIPHSQAGAAYHALSPISPVAINQYGHPHHVTAPFYSPDLLSLSLAHQANSILQPLDRQLVFGAYSMETGSLSAQGLMDGVSDWDGLTQRGPRGPAAEAAARRALRNNLNGDLGSHGQMLGDDSVGMFGPEASSAWFMPFNMEPPDIGADMGLGMGGLDGFGAMFSTSGNAANGMAAQNGAGMGGGQRHATH